MRCPDRSTSGDCPCSRAADRCAGPLPRSSWRSTRSKPPVAPRGAASCARRTAPSPRRSHSPRSTHRACTARWHATLAVRSTRLPAREGTQRFTGRASNAKGVPLDLDFAVTSRTCRRHPEGRRARGRRPRRDHRAGSARQGNHGQLRGEFQALDLSKFVAGVDTRLNGRVTVDGTLQPVRRGRAQLTLSDSRLYGRPVEGHADLRLDGELFDVDTDLTSGAAQLHAKGGLGAGRELAFELSAPRLGDLVPTFGRQRDRAGHHQRVAAGARRRRHAAPPPRCCSRTSNASRSSTSPCAASAAGRAARLNDDARRSPHAGPSGALARERRAGPPTEQRRRTRLPSMRRPREPADSAARRGGWQNDAWRGSVTSLVAGKPLDLQLDAATPVVLARTGIALGPDRVHRARHALRRSRIHPRRWPLAQRGHVCEPAAAGLRSARTGAATRGAHHGRGPAAPDACRPLERRVHATRSTASSSIERTGGDLYSGVDAVHPIGISDIGAALNIVDNRVNGTRVPARSRARQGRRGDRRLHRSRGHATRAGAPLRVNVDATLPDLGWLGPLMSDTVQVQGAATRAGGHRRHPGQPDGRRQGAGPRPAARVDRAGTAPRERHAQRRARGRRAGDQRDDVHRRRARAAGREARARCADHRGRNAEGRRPRGGADADRQHRRHRRQAADPAAARPLDGRQRRRRHHADADACRAVREADGGRRLHRLLVAQGAHAAE